MSKIEYFFTDKNDGNLAYHVNDDKNSVDKNRKNLEEKYNIKIENLFYMNQVHGNNVELIDENSNRVIDNCDGIITASKNLTLMVMVADCIPILFMDRKKDVIAAVHAGRNSTFQKIASITVEKMIENFSCKKEDIEVVMGPAINKCCYEVNEELKSIVENSFSKEYIFGNNIDLQGINKMLLNDIGVRNISISNTCTKCSGEPYFSYRVDKKCGRFAGLITIK